VIEELLMDSDICMVFLLTHSDGLTAAVKLIGLRFISEQKVELKI